MTGLSDNVYPCARVEPNHSIPIIALTAFAEESDRERFFSAGVTDYLTKPVAYMDVVTAIERCRTATSAAA